MTDRKRPLATTGPVRSRPSWEAALLSPMPPRMRRKHTFSLQTRLFGMFILLTLVPASLMAFINERSTRGALVNATHRTLSVAASQTTISLDTWIAATQEAVQTNASLSEFVQFLSLPEEQRSGSPDEIAAGALLDTLSEKSQVRAGLLIDLEGNPLLGTSHEDTQTLSAALGLGTAGLSSFKSQLQKFSQPYVSPVIFSAEGSQASLIFAALTLRPDGEPLGALIILYDAAVLQEQIERSSGIAGAGSFAMLYDENGLRLAGGNEASVLYRLIAPLDPERFDQLQAARRLPPLSAQELTENLTGMAEALAKPDPAGSAFKVRLSDAKNDPHIGAVAPLQSRPWTVAYMQPEAILLAPVSGQNKIMGLMAITMVSITLAVTIFLTRRITKPITLLTGIAERITAGDLWVQAPEGEDEIGLLAKALNAMTTELRRTLSGMEQNIAERTAELASVSEQMKKRASQLQTIAEVAHTIASVQDPDDLLQQITSRISERFGFYHVGIFLIDQAGEWAVLRAANSEGGQRMLARGHKLRVGLEGIVGDVTGRGEPRAALVVGEEAIYFDNPDLPYTRSELALPLRVGDRVFGALDVQSMEQSAFQEEDVTLLNILADQVSIAIENSRLFSETRNTLNELQTLHRQYLREKWAAVVTERHRSGFAYDYGKISPIHEPASSELWEAIEKGEIIQILPQDQKNTPEASQQKAGLSGSEAARLIVPITVRGQVIGMLACGPAANAQDAKDGPGGERRWTEDDINLVKTVADQVGLAIENARLIEETQRRAEREHLVAEITGRLRASNDPQTILQTAALELRQALHARQARFIEPADLPGTACPDNGQNLDDSGRTAGNAAGQQGPGTETGA